MARRRAAYAMAYVTAPDRATARDIARSVLDRRLAACANLWPVESVYRWHGRREETNEFVIVFKTRAAHLPKLIGEVRRLHPSEVPCIVSYPLGPALGDSLDWIPAETVPRWTPLPPYPPAMWASWLTSPDVPYLRSVAAFAPTGFAAVRLRAL